MDNYAFNYELSIIQVVKWLIKKINRKKNHSNWSPIHINSHGWINQINVERQGRIRAYPRVFAVSKLWTVTEV